MNAKWCPTCGQELCRNQVLKCEVEGCNAPAKLEGWYRVIDHMLSSPTGLIQRRVVCHAHRSLLIGGGMNNKRVEKP
jgi:hypothetical protein